MQIKINEELKVVGIYYGTDIKDGWISVQEPANPEQRDGYYPVMHYRNGKIEYEYLKNEEPEVEEVPHITPDSYDAQVDALIRERYSLSNELAILRQREEKPAEFEAYNAYCEECKTRVKNNIK